MIHSTQLIKASFGALLGFVSVSGSSMAMRYTPAAANDPHAVSHSVSHAVSYPISLTPPNPTYSQTSVGRTIPRALGTQILQDLRQRLGLPESETANIRMVRSQRANLQVCLPTPGAPGSDGDCRPATQLGWRVTAAAQGQSWIYYADRHRNFMFDDYESVNSAIKNSLARQLNIPVQDLRIKAAQLTTVTPPLCTPNEICVSGYQWGWRIITESNPRLFHLDSQGRDFQRGWQERTTSAGLPLVLKNAVLRDVGDRHGSLAANLRVESIKAIRWNWCGGGSAERPTPPDMGICDNRDRTGWQMIVQSGPIRYVYYLERGANPNTVAPDGMQSVPESVRTLVRQEAARRGNTTPENIGIQKVYPQFFDGCLDVAGNNCRNRVQAGWLIMMGGVPGGPSPNNGASTVWFYHVDLFGTQARFVRAGTWAPPPVAPPIR